jgi:ParB family chromosome partitioning protein
MTQKKTTLGRGLADLLGQARPIAPRAGEGSAASGTVQGAAASGSPGAPARVGDEMTRLPVDLLQRGQYQPRSDMRSDTLTDLADSIRAQGIVQPIVIRPLDPPPPGGQQRYEIIAGERRWRAAQMAGLSEVPVVIRHVPDEAAIAMALIENIQREDLNPLEEARALERLIAEFGLTHQQAAEAVGRSRAAVSNLLRLLELAPQVAERVEKREIEMGHARAMLGLTSKKQQIEVATLVAQKGLTVRDTEALVRKLLEPKGSGSEAPAKSGLDPNIRRLQDDLADRLGATVKLEHSVQGKGRLIVTYNSLDELDGILNHIQ